MTVETDLQTISADLAALQAVVRGLCRAYSGRSPAALAELLEGLSAEADRLEQTARITGDRVQTGAHALVEAWLDDVREEALSNSRAQNRASF